MFSARNVVAVAVVVMVAALFASVVSLMGEPDSGGAASDSYGTKWHGARAAYEMLSELGVPVERRLLPPSPTLSSTATLVLWQPDPSLVAVEPAYLTGLKDWLERGGRIIVTPRPQSLKDEFVHHVHAEKEKPAETIYSTLGLTGVSVETHDATAKLSLPTFDEKTRQDRIRRGFEKTWRESWNPESVEFVEVRCRATGVLEPAAERTKRLRLPKSDTYSLALGESAEPDGLLEYDDAQGNPRIVAAAFERGEGRIVVVADPAVLMNAGLGFADNSVLTYDLLSAGGRSIVFDEFYHGLAVRGNPLWLLTRARYAVGAVVLTLLVAAVVWRRAVALGPPLEARPRSRRTIIEYVRATARLFHQSPRSRPFVLDETYHGALRYLGEHLNLPPGEPSPDKIAQTLERRRPADAARFRAAVAAVEAAQRRGRKLSESEALVALQGICRCL